MIKLGMLSKGYVKHLNIEASKTPVSYSRIFEVYATLATLGIWT